MFAVNTTLTLRYGTRIRIGHPIASGGEGFVYNAVNASTGEPGVYKVMKNTSPERARRIKFLVDQRLGELCESLCAPFDFYDNHHVGHFSPLAPGVSLEQYLDAAGNHYPETYKLAIVYAHALALLLERGIAQGDPGINQANVSYTATGLELRLFDFDNFSAPGVPSPMCFGQEERMAPELRRAMQGGPPALPDEKSDRYALATVLHDMLLAKSVASGLDNTPEELEQAMSSGWPLDPVYGMDSPASGGYPTSILNAELAAMFRRGLSPNREQRTSAVEWTRVLNKNFSMIWVDPRCHGPSFVDPNKTSCPICGSRFPNYSLIFPALGKEIPCDCAAVAIGRADLRSPSVSSLHAVVRKYGQEIRCQTLGKNGTYRWNGKEWRRLEGEAVLQKADRLSFADVECVVEEII